MTLNEYRQQYSDATAGRSKAEAHRVLIGAERALCKLVAPVYASHIGQSGVTLKTTGEYDAYYSGYNSVDLDNAEVMRLAPDKRMYEYDL